MGREKDGREGRKISAGPAVAPRSLGSFWITAATSLVLRTATSFTAWPRDARVALMLTRVAQIQRVPRFIGSALMVGSPGPGGPLVRPTD